MALFLRNRGVNGGEWSASRAGRSTPGKETAVLVDKGSGWAP